MELQVWLTSVLWGSGTAVGEIPPYYLSYKASQQSRQDERLTAPALLCSPGLG